MLPRSGVVITVGWGSLCSWSRFVMWGILGRSAGVPLVVLGYVAAQAGVADPWCVKCCTERDKTRLAGASAGIAGVYGLRLVRLS